MTTFLDPTTLPDGSIPFIKLEGLTPGSIPFADDSGELIEDNLSIKWDASSGCLKITKLGILEGGDSPTHYTIFQGGDQDENIAYTLPSTNENGFLSNIDGTLFWYYPDLDDIPAGDTNIHLTTTLKGYYDTAYGWGNHAGLYDLLGTAAGLIGTHEGTYNHAHYDTAYGWGNHAAAGYALLTGANQPFTGDLNISKVNPSFSLVDTVDSNSAIFSRTSVNALAQITNVVNRVITPDLALEFDGVGTDLVSIPWDGVQTNFSMAIWVYPDAIGATMFVMYPNLANRLSMGIAILNTGQVRVYLTATNTSWNYYAAGDTILSATDWSLVCWKFDGGTGTFKLFVNDREEILTETGALPAQIYGDTVSKVYLGIYFTTNQFNGRMDECAMWNRTLTDAECSDLYNAGPGLYVNRYDSFPSTGTGMDVNLYALYHFDEGVSAQYEDFSGNARWAIVTGTVYSNAGCVTQAAGDQTVTVWSSEDGAGTGNTGVQTFGDPSGHTIINGRELLLQVQDYDALSVSISRVSITRDLVLGYGKRLFFDGIVGDTYITTSTASANDSLNFYANNVLFQQMLRYSSSWYNSFPISLLLLDNIMLTMGTAVDASLGYNIAQTPDSLVLGLSADSRALVVCEKADIGFDFAHPLQATPTLFFHSAAQSTTQWLSATHDGTNGVLSTGTGKIRSESTFQTSAGRVLNRVAVSSTPFAVLSTHHYLAVDTSVARTLNLPAATTAGMVIIVKDATGNAFANNITVARNGTDTIDTIATDYIISTNFSCIVFIGDGVSNWELT